MSEMTHETCFADIGMHVKSGAIEILIKAWKQPHRFYHNENHLLSILNKIKRDASNFSQENLVKLYLAAYYHDACYNPLSKNNEALSIEMFLQHSACSKPVEEWVVKAITATADHTAPQDDPLVIYFLDLDIGNLLDGTVADMIFDGDNIFREFQVYDFQEFKAGRIKFLEFFKEHVLRRNPKSNIQAYIDYTKYAWSPRIALYPGSFFPFHNGHYFDILKKAERIFDKVIIGYGTNPEKRGKELERFHYIKRMREEIFPFKQIVEYDGFLHNYIKSLSYPVTIVKCLRNPYDFDSEKLQLRYMEDFMPDIKIVYIIGDRATEHVSSSGIRMLQSFGETGNDYLPT